MESRFIACLDMLGKVSYTQAEGERDFLLLLACTMSGLLVWHKPRDWLALLVALMFILLVTIDSISPLELNHPA